MTAALYAHKIQLLLSSLGRSGLQLQIQPNMPSADFCIAVKALAGFSVRAIVTVKDPAIDTIQTSRGKFVNFQYTTAGFTLQVLDGYGLCNLKLTRPTLTPQYPISVRQLVLLFHASFRRYLTITPLRFPILHLQGLSPFQLTNMPGTPERLPAIAGRFFFGMVLNVIEDHLISHIS